MDITTIMVPMGRAEASPDELELVSTLARQLGARVLGVMARELNPALYYEAGVVAGDIVAEDRRRLGGILATAETRFRSVMGTQHPSVEWRSSIDWPTDFALCQARSADLIVSFHRPIRVDADLEIGTLVLKAGRPVLLLDESGLPPSSKVLVAWKDTREARRAVRDALPILRRASAVHIIEVVEGDWSQSAAKDHLKDVVAWLATHEIKATSATHGSKVNVTEQVDAAARDLGANLIVAGGYGHTRLGEWVFGGMTHHQISECGRSVLLSH
jgi:nucleotide-binding universal stress UspA family protein